MNKLNSCLLGVVTLAISFTSCLDDELVKGSPLPKGSEIQFGIVPKADGTRTYYDPNDISDEGAPAWDIFWNYGENDKDHIYIYSPDAAPGHNQAEYIVNATTAESNAGVCCIKAGESGLLSGSENPHDFYAAYPASNVKPGLCADTRIKMTMPFRQSALYAGYTQGGLNYSDLPAAEIIERNFSMEPDMSCALMIGKNMNVTLKENEPVGLLFKALATCLDITINGGTNDITNDPERITSVVIEAYKSDGVTPANIAGDFTYNFDDNTVSYDTSSDSNATNRVVVSTLTLDKDGNEIGIPVVNKNKMNLKAFILPDSDVDVIKVRVFNKHAKYYTKTLDTSHFHPGQISKVVLPKINPDYASVDYGIWLSQLDARIFISELSLPGSQFAFSYFITDDDSEKAQTETFRQQMQAGSRVFHAYVGLGSGNIPCIVTSKGDVVKSGDSEITLDFVVSEIAKTLEENHRDEFCVLALSDCVDYSVNHTDDLVPLMTGIKDVLSRYTDKLATDVNANTTISDVKGKIIVKYQLNGNGGYYDGSAIGNTDMDYLLYRISNWSKMDGISCLFNWYSPAYETQLAYDPIIFGQIGSFKTNGSFPKNQYRKPTITAITDGLAITAANMLIYNAHFSR